MEIEEPEPAEGGATSRIVAFNVRRYRRATGRTLLDLATELVRVRHPLSKLTLGRIENGQRRVDVDDLTALAVVLGVTPNALLLPPVKSAAWLAGLTGTGTRTTASLWDWASGERALWPFKFEAADSAERAELHEARNRRFLTAITPEPPGDDVKAEGIVVHGSEWMKNGDD